MGSAPPSKEQEVIVIDEDDPGREITPEPIVVGANEVFIKLQSKVAMDQSLKGGDFEYRFVSGCNVTYFEQTTDFTCSYSSLMMVISGLYSHSPIYRECLFNGVNFVPDVVSIQFLLESAWAKGYDIEGSTHFDGSLVGKKMRIGPSDIAALMRANGVPTYIYDFDYGNDSFSSVLAFILECFFAQSDQVLPMVLGNASHTVVVVGCRRSSTAFELLIFDPSLKASRAVRCESVQDFVLSSHRAKQFQLLRFGPTKEHPELLLSDTSPVKCGSKELFAMKPPRVSFPSVVVTDKRRRLGRDS